jgi:hypothetical protein
MDTNWTWWALKNNKILITHEILNIDEELTPNKKAPQKDISEFDKNTRIG